MRKSFSSILGKIFFYFTYYSILGANVVAYIFIYINCLQIKISTSVYILLLNLFRAIISALKLLTESTISSQCFTWIFAVPEKYDTKQIL